MTRLNWSTLRLLAISPRLLRHRVDNPQPDTPAMRLGRAIHSAILTPEAGMVVRGACAATTKAGVPCGNDGSVHYGGEWFCRVRGHAPDGAEDAPPDAITAEEGKIVARCMGAVADHRHASGALSGGVAEHEAEWEFDGVLCRGRIDYLTPAGVVDLKTTRRATPREFVRDAASGLYHAQLAWYLDGARAASLTTGAKAAIVAVETVEPHDVAVYDLTEQDIEAGRNLYRDLLVRYKVCMETDVWPGHSPDVRALGLPAWAAGAMGPTETEEW